MLILLLLLVASAHADDKQAIEEYFRLVAGLNANWAQEVSTYQEAMNLQKPMANSKRIKNLTALQEAAEANLEKLREAKPPASAQPLADRWVAVWEMKTRLYRSGIEMVKGMIGVESTKEKPEQRRGVEAVMRLLKTSQTLSEQIAKDATKTSKDTQEYLQSKGVNVAGFE